MSFRVKMVKKIPRNLLSIVNSYFVWFVNCFIVSTYLHIFWSQVGSSLGTVTTKKVATNRFIHISLTDWPIKLHHYLIAVDFELN